MTRAVYSDYDPATGEIFLWGICDADLVPPAMQGKARKLNLVEAGEEFEPSDLYVVDDQYAHRPLFPLLSSIVIPFGSTHTITGLPDPCTVMIDEQEHTVTGGTLEIEGAVVAEYVLTFKAFPYLDHQMQVTVDETDSVS